MELDRDEDPTRQDPAPAEQDEPSADADAPTTELSATDPDATREWAAPAADEDPRAPGEPAADGTLPPATAAGETTLGPREPSAGGAGEPAADTGDALGDTGAASTPATDAGGAFGDAAAGERATDAGGPFGDAGAAGDPATDAPARDPEALRDWPAGDTRETHALDLVERDRMPGSLPDTDFAVVWRGYDVHAVDAYVAAAEAAIASYEERTLPTVAVQRALDRVGEQTASILREAEQAAEETARASRAQADERLQRAEREATELRAAAEARVRDLDDDIERLWQERQRLIEATRDLADALSRTAAEAEARFPPAAPGPPPPPPFDAATSDADADAPDDGVPLEDRDVELDGESGDELDRGNDRPA